MDVSYQRLFLLAIPLPCTNLGDTLQGVGENVKVQNYFYYTKYRIFRTLRADFATRLRRK